MNFLLGYEVWLKHEPFYPLLREFALYTNLREMFAGMNLNRLEH